jgi:hypothetical protein
MSSHATFSLLFTTVLPVKTYMAALMDKASEQISYIQSWRQPTPNMMVRPLRKRTEEEQQKEWKQIHNKSGEINEFLAKVISSAQYYGESGSCLYSTATDFV